MSVWSITPTIDWIIVFGGSSRYQDTAVIELSKYMYVHVNNNLTIIMYVSLYLG